MGYGNYFIDGKERGYGVSDVCNQEGCEEAIDRGLFYLCHGCGGYFCGEHMAFGAYCEKHDEAIEQEGTFTAGIQCCEKCEKQTEAWAKENPLDCHPELDKEKAPVDG